MAEWARHVGFEPAPHHQLLIDKLEQVARGEINRLMIFMPPGHAKSTYASVLFPAWLYAQDPDLALIAASHTGKLAERFGRRVRNLLSEHGEVLGVKLSDDSQAAGQWATDGEGEYFAAGVGGAITGRRANVALIDDPIASQEDADSENKRETTWEWYLADLRTRLKKGGRIIIINTRWHEDDLCGRILPEAYNGESGWIEARDGEKWYVLALPALAESASDPMGRQPGEALWPSEYPVERLLQEQKTIGPKKWASLFQQRPKPLEGSLFKPDSITVIDALPAGLSKTARGWDLAATEKIGGNNPDWNVGVKMARDKDGRIYICDVSRQRGSPEDQERQMMAVASQDGRAVEISIPQDPGQAGKVQVKAITRMLLGHSVFSSPESGDKATRAAPYAAQVNVGNVFMLRAPWNKAYTDELRAFPNGTKDDQVDASARAFERLIAPPAPAKRHNLHFMPR